jgi:hypothetical protein
MKGSLELGSKKYFLNCLFLEKNIMTFPPLNLLPPPPMAFFGMVI